MATCLDTQNVPSLPGIPPREVETGWMHVKDMLVVLIDEPKDADASMCTYVTDDGESGDQVAVASSASARHVNKSSSDIPNEEIVLWRIAHTHTNTHTHTQKPSGLYSLFLRCEKQYIPKKKTCSCPRLSLLVVQIYEHLQLHLK